MASDDAAGRLVDISTTVIPGDLAQGVEMTSKVADTLENAGVLTGVAADAYHLGKAIYTDSSETEKKGPANLTIQETASAAVGWAEATAGSSTGANIGAAIGAKIGAAFGEAGAFPLAYIGGAIGRIVESTVAKAAVNESVSSDSEHTK